jgi:hypothetical protein
MCRPLNPPLSDDDDDDDDDDNDDSNNNSVHFLNMSACHQKVAYKTRAL